MMEICIFLGLPFFSFAISFPFSTGKITLKISLKDRSEEDRASAAAFCISNAQISSPSLKRCFGAHFTGTGFQMTQIGANSLT